VLFLLVRIYFRVSLRPMLDFIQPTEGKTRKAGSTVDLIQRETGKSGEIPERATPDWTKSNQAGGFREKASFWLDKIQRGQGEPSKLNQNPNQNRTRTEPGTGILRRRQAGLTGEKDVAKLEKRKAI